MSIEPVHGYTFTNWGETVSERPKNFFQPASEDELCAIVGEIARAGSSLRVVGAGHAWSPVAISDDNMVNLDKLDKLVEVDAAKKRVTVQAGIRLHVLNDALAEHGLALSDMGSIAQQSIAGATSTGTHGTGVRRGNMSSYITGLTLIGADGKRTAVDQDRDAELITAARLGLGMLGVVSQVTLQCEPAFDLEMLAWPMPYDEAVANLDSLLATNEFVRYYWFAGTDVIQVTTMNPTTKPRTHSNKILDYFKEVVLDTDLLHAFDEVGYWFPGLVGPLDKFSATVGWTREERVDRSDKILTITMPPLHDECEYAIPVEKTADVLRALPSFIASHDYKVNFPMEVRFVKGDQQMISPAYGRDSMYLGAYTFGERFAQPLFAGFEPWMRGFGGRPHWGKTLHLDAEQARAMYPKYDRFNELRRAMDPKGVFANAFTREVFGA